MYATKQAIIAQEHDAKIQPTIFFIDLRAHGKGFESYYQRAKVHHQIRYMRAVVSRVVAETAHAIIWNSPLWMKPTPSGPKNLTW